MDLVTQLRFSRCILDARSMSMTTSVVAFTASVLMPREPRRHATQAHGGRLQPTEIPNEQMIHTFSLLFRGACQNDFCTGATFAAPVLISERV